MSEPALAIPRGIHKSDVSWQHLQTFGYLTPKKVRITSLITYSYTYIFYVCESWIAHGQPGTPIQTVSEKTRQWDFHPQEKNEV